MNEYKLLCQYLGGSHAAELNTPESDIDLRGCYLSTNLGKIMGLNDGRKGTGAPITSDPDCADVAYYELRHFIDMLKTGNSNAMELMFNPVWNVRSPVFINIQKKKHHLIEPASVYRSTRGYAHSEYELAIGSRTGKLGGKRHAALAKHGFSPKNFANLFKILTAARIFFETGNYPVSLKESEPFIHMLLREIREHPERFTKQMLIDKYQELLQQFETAWQDNLIEITQQYCYDPEIAAEVVAQAYLPMIQAQVRNSLIDRLFCWLGTFALAFPK